MTPVFYIPPLMPGRAPHQLLAFRFGAAASRGVFDEDPAPNFFEREGRFAGRIEDATAVILPHNFAALDAAARDYIARHADAAGRLRIPVYAFSFADFSDRVRFDPRVRVFRLSGYRRSLGARDIVVPTTVREFGPQALVLRDKRALPVVSFCGQAGYQTPLQWCKYYLKVLLHSAAPERRLGVYWRRAAMRALARSPQVATRFIIRRSFSGAEKTIELPPKEAREEFLRNITESDFVLAPKGDGNYSNRFLEALALGRIPVLIDTDAALPLPDVVPYDKIMVRVPMADTARTAAYVRDFYDALDGEEWKERQTLARSVFERYLRQSSFFSYYFTQGAGSDHD